MFFRQPTGPEVDRSHIPDLDDEFFSSDPLGYFLSRIESLSRESGPISEDGLAMQRRLHRSPDDMPHPSGEAVRLQRAVDAISLRHHVAETLVRMWLVSLETRDSEPGSASAWRELTDGPVRNSEVIRRLLKHPLYGERQRTTDIVLPIELQDEIRAGSKLAQGLDVLIDWMVYSVQLLRRTDLHISASYNKVKHGLAIRTREDLALDFLPEHSVPNPGSSIPASAFDEGIPIIDRPSVLYLSRAPKPANGTAECLEMTCLKIDTPTVLAECFMLATVVGAVFHSLARRYESWRGQPIGIPAYPTLSLWPTPTMLLGKEVIGVRVPVTFRPDGTASDRTPGIASSDFGFRAFSMNGPGWTAAIVDD